MSGKDRPVFVVWFPYQRRAESLAAEFGAELNYYHYNWEERSKLYKVMSYAFKTWCTLNDLFKAKPNIVFVQLPPTIVLYVTVAYCLFTKTKCIADCHNSMIYGSHWIKWPLAKYLLKRVDAAIVHNEDVVTLAARDGIDSIVLKDPLPRIEIDRQRTILEKHALSDRQYIMVPWRFAPDEPIEELFEAARMMPDVAFVMTWYSEKLPAHLASSMPNNIVLTGFLEVSDFNALFAGADAAIVLTTREGTQPSGASESIVLDVPLIVSDIKTTRRLYNEAAIFVENTAPSIVNGVSSAIENNAQWREKIRAFKEGYRQELAKEITRVKEQIGLVE